MTPTVSPSVRTIPSLVILSGIWRALAPTRWPSVRTLPNFVILSGIWRALAPDGVEGPRRCSHHLNPPTLSNLNFASVVALASEIGPGFSPRDTVSYTPPRYPTPTRELAQ